MMKLLKARIQFCLFVLTIIPVTSPVLIITIRTSWLVAVQSDLVALSPRRRMMSRLYCIIPPGSHSSSRRQPNSPTSLYGIERGSLEEFSSVLFDDYGNIRVDLSDVTVVPSSAGAVRTLGRTRWGTNHSLAFGLWFLRTERLHSRVEHRSMRKGKAHRTCAVQLTVELWSAVGYGLEINPELRVGVAGYYIFRSMVDTEEASISEASIQNGGIGRFALPQVKSPYPAVVCSWERGSLAALTKSPFRSFCITAFDRSPFRRRNPNRSIGSLYALPNEPSLYGGRTDLGAFLRRA